MTGFGKATTQIDNQRITVEIKSVNSKQADLSLKAPSVFRVVEMEIRKLITTALIRGKIDLFIQLENTEPQAILRLNHQLIEEYWNELQNLSHDCDIPLPLDPMRSLLSMPGIYASAAPDETPFPTDELLRIINEAVQELIAFRQQEGEALAQGFRNNISNIRALLAEVLPYERERIENVRTRLEEALNKHLSTPHDPGRLEQEMIFYIEKLDINEEKHRLTQHLDYFITTLENAEPGEGRKLGFIAQEIGREINTLGSKANHGEIQKLVVKMKDELEQIKEQVLNVL